LSDVSVINNKAKQQKVAQIFHPLRGDIGFKKEQFTTPGAANARRNYTRVAGPPPCALSPFDAAFVVFFVARCTSRQKAAVPPN